MGNAQSTQSNNNTNRTRVKITGRIKYQGYTLQDRQEKNHICFELDGMINYQNGNYSQINFTNRFPFKSYRVNDVLLIDPNRTRQADNTQIFTETAMVVRESSSSENQQEYASLLGKGTVGCVLSAANVVCPTAGEIMTNMTKLGGMALSSTDDENVKKLGEVVQGGVAIGSSVNSFTNAVRGDHKKDCFECEDKD